MRIVKLVLLVLVFIGLIVVLYLGFGSYSDGFRAGIVVKLSHKGMLFKTYEGEMNLGSGFYHDQQNVWQFSVAGSDKDVIEKIEKAALSRNRVKLFYEEKYWKLPWVGDTKYLVTGVESAPAPAETPAPTTDQQLQRELPNEVR